MARTAVQVAVAAVAIVALAMAVPVAQAKGEEDFFASTEPMNATCIVEDVDGRLVDESERSCVACQLQCYSNKCGSMTWNNNTVAREELNFFRCDDEDIAVKWWDVCVELDADDDLSEGVYRRCSACLQGCESRGEVGCKTLFFGGVQIPREELGNFTCPPEPSPSPAIPSPVPPSPMPLNCSEPAVRGPCRAFMTRFFYNPETEECEEFVYGGCNGNSNNFNTKDMCEDACAAPKVLSVGDEIVSAAVEEADKVVAGSGDGLKAGKGPAKEISE